MGDTKTITITIKKRKEKGSGTKKYGRNMNKCGRYKTSDTRARNKKRKIAKDAKAKAKKLAEKQAKRESRYPGGREVKEGLSML